MAARPFHLPGWRVLRRWIAGGSWSWTVHFMTMPQLNRLERKGIIKTFPIEEPNSWHMVEKSDIPAIEAYIKEEEERRARRKAERAAQRREAQKEPRIKL